MNVNFNVKLETLDGEPLRVNDEDCFLKNICVSVLRVTDEKLDAWEQIRRYELMKTIHKSDGPIDVSIEDLNLIKQLVTDIEGKKDIILNGQVLHLLEHSNE